MLLRERSGIALTPEGECLQRNAVQLLALWSNAQEELNAIQRAKRKTIRVGFGLMSYNLWDVDHIQRFQALHPNVDVAVSALVSDELWSSLAERKLDIIVTGVRRGGPAGPGYAPLPPADAGHAQQRRPPGRPGGGLP